MNPDDQGRPAADDSGMGTGKWIRMTAFLILVAPTATASYVGEEAGVAAAAAAALVLACRTFITRRA